MPQSRQSTRYLPYIPVWRLDKAKNKIMLDYNSSTKPYYENMIKDLARNMAILQGRNLLNPNMTKEELQRYMWDPNPDKKTGYMICFGGLIRDGWNHSRGTYTCMTALINDPCDESLYNAMWCTRRLKRSCEKLCCQRGRYASTC